MSNIVINPYSFAAEFSPDDISDLYAWYKSDTNVTYSVSGVELIISSWADVDGNQPLIQTYGPAKPRLIDATHGYAGALVSPDLQNGYPYCQTGSNTSVAGVFTTPLTDPFTLVFVTRYIRGVGGAYGFRFNSDGVANVAALPGATETIRSHYNYKIQTGTNYTTSSNSLTIATGALTLVVADDLGWTTGNVIVQYDGNTSMKGSITSYTAGTKTLVLNITSIDGSGTYSSWDVQGISSNFNYTYFPNSTRWDVLINIYDGASSKSIVNGIDNGTGTLPTPIKHKGIKVIFASYLEIIAYNKALSVSEIADLNTYLTDKYADTVFADRWSMYFDGVDDYVDCGGDSSLYPGTGDMSYSVWIKPDIITGSNAVILGPPAMSTGSLAVDIRRNSATIQVYVGIGVGGTWGLSLVSTSVLAVGVWCHIALTLDRDGNGVIYVNGSANATGAMNPTYSGTDITGGGQNLQIGEGNDGDFAGNIDDVGMWDTVLDAATVLSLYSSGVPNDLTLAASYTAGSGVDKSGDLQGYWQMGDGATYNGGLALPYTIPDASTNSNTGSFTNGSLANAKMDTP